MKKILEIYLNKYVSSKSISNNRFKKWCKENREFISEEEELYIFSMEGKSIVQKILFYIDIKKFLIKYRWNDFIKKPKYIEALIQFSLENKIKIFRLGATNVNINYKISLEKILGTSDQVYINRVVDCKISPDELKNILEKDEWNKRIFGGCAICKISYNSKKHKTIHLSMVHNIKYRDSVIGASCIFCKRELKSIKNLRSFAKCNNEKCITYINRKKLHTLNIKTTISKRDKSTVSLNYSKAAILREEKLKNTIEDNGKSRKENSYTKERREKQSKTMKDKIYKGEFTPCVTNSWAKSRCYIDSIPFRSSWEAMFYLIKPLPFEKIRVPYIGVDNKKHSYIVDFHDEEKRVLYEIKPSSNIDDEVVQIKEKAALDWCKKNKYSFKFIDETWLSKYISIIEINLKTVSDKNTIRKINANLTQFKKKEKR